MIDLEHVPDGEADQIEYIVELTREQLKKRYASKSRFLRGVHPKDHGCVEAKFTVLESLADEHRVGLFVEPGRQFDAWIRFSNAAPIVSPDSTLSEAGAAGHGSRGMAVKVTGVSGSRLMPEDGELSQDFLMINQPVFAFANVDDYEALSRIILEDNESPKRFFAERVRRTQDGKPVMSDPTTQRALRTAGIVERITDSKPSAFQPPPLSPLDNVYFGAAPFLFGEGKVMRFAAKPVAPVLGEVTDFIKNENYLRDALHQRLTAGDGSDIEFAFQVQVRSVESLARNVDTAIEDACFDWDAEQHPSNTINEKYPFVTVATITIPPQDCSTAERRETCERLTFSPWHGLLEHRPLGGINRLRRAVYETSAQLRATADQSADLERLRVRRAHIQHLRGSWRTRRV
jgi:hypothetical protein